MDFYCLNSLCSNDPDLIHLDDDKIPQTLRDACRKSEFQFIDKHLDTLILDEERGNILSDFIYDIKNNVPVISRRLKSVFDSAGIDHVCYRRIKLLRKSDGFCEDCFLCVPPRIRCLDRENSCIDEYGMAERIVIDPGLVGNFDIFKLSEPVNCEIFVTGRLKEKIEHEKAVRGFKFIKTD